MINHFLSNMQQLQHPIANPKNVILRHTDIAAMCANWCGKVG